MSPKFILPGTHSAYCAWVPPPHIPKEILEALRADMMKDLLRVVGSHSRQSSGAGSEVALETNMAVDEPTLVEDLTSNMGKYRTKAT